MTWKDATMLRLLRSISSMCFINTTISKSIFIQVQSTHYIYSVYVHWVNVPHVCTYILRLQLFVSTIFKKFLRGKNAKLSTHNYSNMCREIHCQITKK